MSLRKLALIPLVLFLTASAAAEVAVSATHLKSCRGAIDDFPILILQGSAAERGEAHGRLAAREIIDTIDTAASALAERGKSSWDTLLAGAGFFTYSKRFESEIAAMLYGINAALPDANDRVVPSLKRPVSAADIKALHYLADLRCSQFSAWGPLTENGQVIIGRNADYAPIMKPSSNCLIAVIPSEPGLCATLDLLAFGSIGAGGLALNEHGVYLAPNNGDPKAYTRPGIEPGPMIYRRALESAGPHSAIADVLAVFTSSDCSYSRIFHVAFPLAAGSTDTPAAIQWDCSKQALPIVVRKPVQDMPHALVITNHFLPGGKQGDSLNRYNAIDAAIRRHMRGGTKIGSREAKAILALVDKDTPQSATILSGIVWPAERKIEFAVSPSRGVSALKGAWRTVEWNDVFGGNAAVSARPR
ncbi:MAG TPA: hypothetical protein ENN09_05100 [Planctomycetes bacterium]|nr:hypothetical protein [Planctomycetota bacterium]